MDSRANQEVKCQLENHEHHAILSSSYGVFKSFLMRHCQVSMRSFDGNLRRTQAQMGLKASLINKLMSFVAIPFHLKSIQWLCKGQVLELAGVVWRSSWWLRSCGTTTRSSSSSPLCLLRPAQTVHLKSIKGRPNLNQTLQGLYPLKEGRVYFLTQVECPNSMQYTRSIRRSTNSGLNTGFQKNKISSTQKGRVLELAGVVWRSSWWLRSCGTTTRSSSSSPLCLLRPAQTVDLKSIKGDYDIQEEEKVEDGNASV
ncbi:hypothetical protein Taro_011630 [Colocasia esculenta]|uniref:Uncharacterized protein n=1 Tax=Colocasia esculenta TaxID=4460 RepID=A0A843UBE6_COLES|nr:hypothetical protein [Colocasia esculenta]